MGHEKSDGPGGRPSDVRGPGGVPSKSPFWRTIGNHGTAVPEHDDHGRPSPLRRVNDTATLPSLEASRQSRDRAAISRGERKSLRPGHASRAPAVRPPRARHRCGDSGGRRLLPHSRGDACAATSTLAPMSGNCYTSVRAGRLLRPSSWSASAWPDRRGCCGSRACGSPSSSTAVTTAVRPCGVAPRWPARRAFPEALADRDVGAEKRQATACDSGGCPAVNAVASSRA